MSEAQDRPVVAGSAPMGFGTPSASMAAPVGAVRRRDRERATRTRLDRHGPAGVLLHTELPGTVVLQRRESDGSWETVARQRAAGDGRTSIDLPTAADANPRRYRVVFAPKNTDIASWVSEPLES